MPAIPKITKRVRILQDQLISNLRLARKRYQNHGGILGEPNFGERSIETLQKIEYGGKEIQGFISDIEQMQERIKKEFIQTSWRTFENDYESMSLYLALMIEEVFNKRGEDYTLTLNLPGKGPVHVPEHYPDHNGPQTRPRPIPGNIAAHYRTNLLLDYIGWWHKKGTLILNGNLGKLFAYGAGGGSIILNGECGHGGCNHLFGGNIVINGIAGHSFLASANSGTVLVKDGMVDDRLVKGHIRAFGYMSEDSKVQCYLNRQKGHLVEGKYDWYFSFGPNDKKPSNLAN